TASHRVDATRKPVMSCLSAGGRTSPWPEHYDSGWSSTQAQIDTTPLFFFRGADSSSAKLVDRSCLRSRRLGGHGFARLDTKRAAERPARPVGRTWPVSFDEGHD